MVALRQPTATIQRTSPRYAEWRQVFGDAGDPAGTVAVPVLSVVPRRADLPGKPSVEIYLIDLAALDPEQRERLIHHLARKFDLPPAEVEHDISERGCPILNEDVTVPIDNRMVM